MSKEIFIQARAALAAIEAEREALIEHTKERYRDAVIAFEEAEESVCDAAGFFADCEGCGIPLFNGEPNYGYEGTYTCSECSPTFEMLLSEPEGFIDLETDEPATAERCRAWYDEAIARGKKPTDSMAA